jgi:2-iminobutanoate/2-iminopropanoate deaminase
MKRTHHPDGTEIAGFYVRAIRTGPFVFVAGTTSLDPKGQVVGAAQTRVTLEKIDKALQSANASLADVVRMTIFVTDIADTNVVVGEIAKAVTRPITSTLVAVSALARPGLVVEIETTAVVTEGG